MSGRERGRASACLPAWKVHEGCITPHSLSARCAAMRHCSARHRELQRRSGGSLALGSALQPAACMHARPSPYLGSCGLQVSKDEAKKAEAFKRDCSSYCSKHSELKLGEQRRAAQRVHACMHACGHPSQRPTAPKHTGGPAPRNHITSSHRMKRVLHMPAWQAHTDACGCGVSAVRAEGDAPALDEAAYALEPPPTAQQLIKRSEEAELKVGWCDARRAGMHWEAMRWRWPCSMRHAPCTRLPNVWSPPACQRACGVCGVQATACTEPLLFIKPPPPGIHAHAHVCCIAHVVVPSKQLMRCRVVLPACVQ